jgi:hypothetical protein
MGYFSHQQFYLKITVRNIWQKRLLFQFFENCRHYWTLFLHQPFFLSTAFANLTHQTFSLYLVVTFVSELLDKIHFSK